MNDITRRHFFSRSTLGLGTAALASLLPSDGMAATGGASGALPGLPHHAPTAKRVIYLFQHGAPSQLDLFDYKPGLAKRFALFLALDKLRHGLAQHPMG